MDKFILVIVAFCFIIGLIDYVLENRFGFGDKFKEGINNMGSLALAMIGILTITPLISQFILSFTQLFQGNNNFDVSVILSSIIAVDMGAYNVAKDIAISNEMVIFSGILIASIIGCTMSFTLPLALGVVNKKHVADLNKGIILGFITAPIALLIGGIILKIKFTTILVSLIPIILFALILCIGLMINKELVLKVLTIFGKILVVVGAVGLGIQGINSILGLNILQGVIMPLEESIKTVGKIAIFLGGAYVLIHIINLKAKRFINLISSKLKISTESASVLIGSLASAVVVFTSFDKLDERGRIICSAFSVGGAYVLGGQLGYVVAECPEYAYVYIITKILSGVFAIILSIVIYPYLNKKVL